MDGKTLPATIDTFLTRIREDRFFISAVTVGELQKGIALAPHDRRDLLQQRLGELTSLWADRILPIDTAAAVRWGELTAACKRSGIALAPIDGLIAATAIARTLAIASRDAVFARLPEVLAYDPHAP